MFLLMEPVPLTSIYTVSSITCIRDCTTGYAKLGSLLIFILFSLFQEHYKTLKNWGTAGREKQQTSRSRALAAVEALWFEHLFELGSGSPLLIQIRI